MQCADISLTQITPLYRPSLKGLNTAGLLIFRVCVCVCVCTRVWVSECMCVCVCVCVCMCVWERESKLDLTYYCNNILCVCQSKSDFTYYL